MNLINGIFVVTQSSFLKQHEDQRDEILIIDFDKNNYIKLEKIKVPKRIRNLKKILNFKMGIFVISSS